MRALLVRAGLVAAGGACVVALGSAAPLLLRELPSFRVTSVEVTGAHWLLPGDALKASGIDRRANVFDDPAPWLARLRAHPLVEDAHIERRLPATLRLHIREAVPVALARTPELRPVDARGRVLPMNPAGLDLDLPVLGSVSRPDAAGRLSDDESLSLLEALTAVIALEPGLATLISEALPEGDGTVRLRLRSPAGAELIVPRRPDPLRLREMRLALADLERRDELTRLRRMDARYEDQLVVALGPKETK